VLDLLLPQRCLCCSLAGAQVCADCTAGLRRVTAPLCERCGTPTAWPVRRCAECAGRRLAFARARAAVAYDDPVPAIVAAWKERGLRGLAGWAAAIIAEALPRPHAACLSYIPGDADRRLQRGHHAAERLARELGEAWQLPTEPLLRRAPGSRRQRGLSRPDRRRNVAGAFEPNGRAPPQVCLVDDVYTTGATVNAAASTLRRAGARRVEVVTFARTIRVR
jgi:predicted amidophosphoribosyltransferase